MRDDPWLRCRACRSVYRDIAPDKFAQLHTDAGEDPRFCESLVETLGHQPASQSWDHLALPGSSVLEIGPGTGHLLAAAQKAGRCVTAVEASEMHRRFIKETWGIGSVYADISELPRGLLFDVIVAINVVEHIYDIAAFFRFVAGALAPNGVFFISTPNAASLEATVLRAWWSMCKEIDHVSFPTSEGMARASQAAGLRAERVWSSELPLEFPISILVAARDWTQVRLRPASVPGDVQASGSLPENGHRSSTARLARFYGLSSRFDPTSRLLASLGRAGTIKAHLRQPTDGAVQPAMQTRV
jgi:2-polyprenyl-3-methyl-5-hydroxy-6-metoxy-1,4-benzoquinol methylase